MRFTKRLRWRWGFARVVRAQVRTGRPAEARATFARLRGAGVSPRAAYRMLAAVYEAEVASMLVERRVYDHDAYVRRLALLPQPPTISLDDVPSRERPRIVRRDEGVSRG